MADNGIKRKLEMIRETCEDIKSRIGEILDKDDRIDIASMNADSYVDDLFKLMRDTADTAAPVLEIMGIKKEAITNDVHDFIKILDDNQPEIYFASLNVDAKYKKNHHTLSNVVNWLNRLETSINKIEIFIEARYEREELKDLFSFIDKTQLSSSEKQILKDEFLKVFIKLKAEKF